MKIIIDYNIHWIDTDIISVEPEINVKNYKATEEETTILKNTTKSIKEICKAIENNYP